MRKLLLASTALVGIAAFAPTAHAQTKDTPLNVNLGGYVDFRAGYFTGSEDINPTTSRRNHDFESEYRLNVDIDGKAMRGIEYGGRLSLTNATVTSAFSGGTSLKTADAYVFLSGQYGKVVMGDHNGASDLFVYAPTVGLGQVDGQYTNFAEPASIGQFQPSYIENGSDYSSKVTYMTPQLGNDKHKVQLGVSYAPNLNKAGQQVRFDTNSGTYRNNIEGAVQYKGDFKPVSVVLSSNIQSGVGTTNGFTKNRDFVQWGVGGQVGYGAFTVGGSYVDAGSFGTTESVLGVQDKKQKAYTAGIKYEANKYAVAFSWLGAKGYSTPLTGATNFATSNVDYVKSFNAYSLGGTYTWFPGMATQADATAVSQERSDVSSKNMGYIFVVSQKLTF